MHNAETFLQVNSDNDDFDLSMDDLTNNFNFINNLNNNSSTSHHLPHHHTCVTGGGDDRYMLLRDVNVIQRIVEETKGDVAFRPLIKYIYNRRDLLLIALKNRLGLNELDEYYEKKGIIPFYCSDRDFMMQAVKMSGHHLSFASDTLKKDRELVLEAVKSDGNAIFLDHCFGLDREIVFTALKSKYLVTIDFFNNVWFNDREFVEYAVKYKARVLKKALFFVDDKQIVLDAVRKNGMDLRYASEDLRNDRLVVMTAVIDDGAAIQFAPQFQADKEMALIAVKTSPLALSYLHFSMKADKDVALAAVSHYGQSIQYVSQSLRTNREIILKAVKNNLSALTFCDCHFDKETVCDILQRIKLSEAPIGIYPTFCIQLRKHMDSDRNFTLRAVNTLGESLKYAPKSQRQDREIVLAAIRNQSTTLGFAEEPLQKDPEIGLEAINSHDKFFFIHRNLLSDRDFLMKALKKNPQIFVQLDCFPFFVQHVELVLEAVSHDYTFFRPCASVNFSREFLIQILNINGLCLEFMEQQYKSDRELVWHAIKQNIHAFPHASIQMQKDKEMLQYVSKRLLGIID
ncbi:predicted protein [Naegleria gruberi]|uniref:Predicted protein n=1 Tax=Naegleria gruberi TaxID=5762 RepID=D2VNP6_NAEGR|nr:uncharacterized protein NAEGRDRAFT_70572 [Naegleria gruberi]EFC41540.1 predicted protein [Naegleria gruberi]|eukprot:XP_002674284.1 predicted protein [Naegleria gruberi strain NEG-M]